MEQPILILKEKLEYVKTAIYISIQVVSCIRKQKVTLFATTELIHQIHC